MNTHLHTDAWMHRIMIALVLIIIVSVIGAITMVAVLNQPISELLIVSGIVAAAGLVRLLMPSLLIGSLYLSFMPLHTLQGLFRCSLNA